VSYLVSLGAKARMTFADLQRMAQERFLAEDLYQLSKADASQMIDELKPETSRR
jgi:DNA-binding MarR family transcriptional regulator